jgi:nucleoid-associated protein YgaU
MKNAISVLLLLSLSSACAVWKPKPKVVQTTVASDGTEIIELESPIQQELDQQWGSMGNMSAHTVYDSEKKIEKYKDVKKTKFIENLAGPYKFHVVKNKESLAGIATKLYGDKGMWRVLQSWNLDVLPTPDAVAVGMKIKYLPKEHKYFSRIKNNLQPNRLPASKK